MNIAEVSLPTQSGFRKWAPLCVLSFALLIIVLDTTILNVSLRTIIGDLDTTIQKIQWVITAYSLTLAAFTITGGRLGDLFGRKKIFIAGSIIFAIGSFITSISHSVGMMVIGEAIIEGIGAAMMMPATSALLVATYKGRDRQTAFGIWGGIAAAGAALGPVIGGWLTTAYSWRWAFRINVFVVLILLVFSYLLPESKDTKEKSELDIGGIFLSASGLLLLVFGFIEASTYGWVKAKEVFMIGEHEINIFGGISIVIPVLLLGIIFLLLFAFWEKRREMQGHTPLVSMSLFANKQFTFSASVMAILALSQTGMSFTLPVFLQSVKNLDAFHTGLVMLPMPLALLFAAPFSAYLTKFFTPKRIIQAGLVLTAIGFVALILGLDISSSSWTLAPGFILFGIGMGFMFAQSNNMTLSAVSVDQSGEASGVNGTMRTIGATLGSAVLGAILLSTLASNLIQGVSASKVIPENLKPEVSEMVREQTSSIEFGGGAKISNDIPAEIAEELKSISAVSTVQASKTTLIWGIGFILLALLLAFKLPNSKNVEVGQSAVIAH